MVTVYWIIKFLTFPGTLLKAFLEHLFCRIYKVPVEFAEYLQRNELCGHAEHLLAEHKGSFAICFGPHIIMLLLGLMTALPASIGLGYLGSVTPAAVILFYIAVSILTNLFPLYEDALHMWDHLYGEGSGSSKGSRIALAVSAFIMRIGSFLEQYGLTLITSVVFTFFFAYVVAIIIK